MCRSGRWLWSMQTVRGRKLWVRGHVGDGHKPWHRSWVREVGVRVRNVKTTCYCSQTWEAGERASSVSSHLQLCVECWVNGVLHGLWPFESGPLLFAYCKQSSLLLHVSGLHCFSLLSSIPLLDVHSLFILSSNEEHLHFFQRCFKHTQLLCKCVYLLLLRKCLQCGK